MSRASTSTETPRLSSSRMAVIRGASADRRCRSSQSCRGGSGCAAGEQETAGAQVGEPGGHQETECAKAAGDEVCRVGSASQRLAYRLAGHRHEFREQEYAVAQHQHRSCSVWPESRPSPWRSRGDRGRREINQTTPDVGMFGGDDTRQTPQAALPHRGGLGGFADAGGQDPQRDRVAVGTLGQLPHQVGHVPPTCRTAASMSGSASVGGLGVRDVEDVTGVGELACGVAGAVEKAARVRRLRGGLGRPRSPRPCPVGHCCASFCVSRGLPVDRVGEPSRVAAGCAGRLGVWARVPHSAANAARCRERPSSGDVDVDDHLVGVAAGAPHGNRAMRCGSAPPPTPARSPPEHKAGSRRHPRAARCGRGVQQCRRASFRLVARPTRATQTRTTLVCTSRSTMGTAVLRRRAPGAARRWTPSSVERPTDLGCAVPDAAVGPRRTRESWAVT